jgi:hypothetical protein
MLCSEKLRKLKYGVKPQFSMGRIELDSVDAARPATSAKRSSRLAASVSTMRKNIAGSSVEIVANGIGNMRDLLPIQALNCGNDTLDELGLVHESGGDVHEPIIARSRAVHHPRRVGRDESPASPIAL